jgi:hypothetical protein
MPIALDGLLNARRLLIERMRSSCGLVLLEEVLGLLGPNRGSSRWTTRGAQAGLCRNYRHISSH